MEQISYILKTLSDETRLRVVNLFVKSKTNLCVCEVMDALKIPQYAASKAINQIKKANLLVSSKEGTWIYYGLNKEIKQNNTLFSFLEIFLTDKVFSEDEARLNKRLLLREKNRCVVGIIPESDLLKMIRQKVKA
ncbi:MAG: transcriptional regulator [Ignavibacteriales bacterium CG_4_9_14_3_um_filter_34_10]|nr:MAG: transcriptional regulator [Ignavibacteriales bacterium CG_4_9_14_3_um_filter_34_10]